MTTRRFEIHNDVGLHARPATIFTQRAGEFAAAVTVAKDGRTANAKSLLSLLQLDIQPGDAFEVHADGEDAEQALEALGELIDSWSRDASGEGA